MMRSWIVLGLLGLGRVAEAAALNEANIAHCRATGDRYMEPECLRLKGELTLRADRTEIHLAEHQFREAVASARARSAKSWELRAAISLARLLQSADRRKEAIAVLEPLIDWFMEGRETHDLREAGALLSSLN